MYKWVEVNVDAIINNYQQVREFVKTNTKILGVVKADAYGHGMVEVARELEKQGIDYLGVTEIFEGIQLRDAGIKTPILVFSPFLPEDIYYLKEYELTVSLSDIETIKLIVEQNISLNVHLKLETGLGRTGLKLNDLEEMVKIIKGNDNINVQGVYTHLATAMWSDSSYVLEQYNKFIKAVEFIENKGLTIPLKHICNSAALAKFPQMHLDMVRAGTVLYGQQTSSYQVFAEKLQNAWSLKGQIIYINQLPKGQSIGYERTHILKRDSRTAVVPIGFSHGFSVEPIPRPKGLVDLLKILIKNILRFFDHSLVKTYAKIKDKKAPILGKVGMQITILDITDFPEVRVGDIAELPGRRTNISATIPKVYMKSGKPVKVQRTCEKYEEHSMVAK